MTPPTIVLLAIGFFVCGFGWGFALTYKYMVLPARAQAKKVIDMSLEHIEKQMDMLTGLLEGPEKLKDGSVRSHIQIKRIQ